MRKTLSIVLSVLMLLSVCSFAIPASAAPEGTAIKTADDFMNMAAEGKYYLDADITLAGSYINPFVGTFDGNGHTVTVSAPMFLDFSGEVKNLTINGEIVFVDADAAAFAVKSTGGFNATNCTNNANITVSGSGHWAGGFVADMEENEQAFFINCVNNGNISCDTTDLSVIKPRVGGFGGIIDSVSFYDCTNNGKIYAKGINPIAGGFVARTGLNTATRQSEAFNCVNNGDVLVETLHYNAENAYTTGGAQAAGIFGYIGGKGNSAWYKVWGCANNGKIDGPSQVGGFVGYCYASGSNAFLDIQFSINTGDIVYGRTNNDNDPTKLDDYGSPFISYTNSNFTTIKYCIDTGTVTRHEGHAAKNSFGIFVGCSSADSSQYDIHDVYVLNKDQYTFFSWANADSNETQRRPISEKDGDIIVTTLEEIKSGKVAYLINEAAAKDDFGFATMDASLLYDQGEYAFYQKLGTDSFPAGRPFDVEGSWIVLDGTNYKNGAKEEEVVTTTEPPVVTTEPVEDPTEPVEDPTEAPTDPVEVPTDAPVATDAPAATDAPKAEGGCGGMISGAVAIVAILGTALVIKKRD